MEGLIQPLGLLFATCDLYYYKNETIDPSKCPWLLSGEVPPGESLDYLGSFPSDCQGAFFPLTPESRAGWGDELGRVHDL